MRSGRFVWLQIERLVKLVPGIVDVLVGLYTLVTGRGHRFGVVCKLLGT